MVAKISVAFVAAVLVLVVGPTSSTAQEALGGYQVALTSNVAGFTPNTPGLAVADPVAELLVGHTYATLDSGPRVFARSSSAWPGLIGSSAGTAGCAAAGVCGIPDYPVRAEAQSPKGLAFFPEHTEPAPGVVMDAKATPEGSTATHSLGAVDVPGAVSFGSSRSVAITELRSDAVVGRGSTALTDVKVAGGVLAAESITSTAESVSKLGGGSSSGSVVVEGLTVNGIPARVDEQGIHADTQTTNWPAEEQALRAALAQAGIDLVRAGSVEVIEGSGVTRQTSGLLVRMTRTDLPQPVAVTLLLGSVTAVANAQPGTAPAGADTPLPDLPTPVDALPGTGGDTNLGVLSAATGSLDMPAPPPALPAGRGSPAVPEGRFASAFASARPEPFTGLPPGLLLLGVGGALAVGGYLRRYVNGLMPSTADR